MVAPSKHVPMTLLIDEIPDSPFFSDDYSSPKNPIQVGAESVSSAVSFATPSPGRNLSPKYVWKKISDGVSNNKGKIIAATTIIAFAVLSHFVGLIGALALGAICLIFISRR